MSFTILSIAKAAAEAEVVEETVMPNMMTTSSFGSYYNTAMIFSL